jgi:hypothetical protein
LRYFEFSIVVFAPGFYLFIWIPYFGAPKIMRKRNGYAAMLGFLIVIAIGMLIYFLEMNAIFGPSRSYLSRPATPEDHPWQMEDLLVPENQIIPVPKKGQPELLEPVNLTASVQRNHAPRGSVNIAFGKDCRIVADWSSDYEYDKKTFQIQTQMKGNVVPSRVYCDANKNEDKTRLFFIAKGPYTQTTHQADTPPRTEQGTAYILGWLRPDNTAEGAITITTDQSWSAVYPFQSIIKKPASSN